MSKSECHFPVVLSVVSSLLTGNLDCLTYYLKMIENRLENIATPSHHKKNADIMDVSIFIWQSIHVFAICMTIYLFFSKEKRIGYDSFTLSTSSTVNFYSKNETENVLWQQIISEENIVIHIRNTWIDCQIIILTSIISSFSLCVLQ